MNQDLAAAHESFRQSQRNVRDEIARRRREHTQMIEKRQQEAAEAKAKAEAAKAAEAKAAGGAKPEAAK